MTLLQLNLPRIYSRGSRTLRVLLTMAMVALAFATYSRLEANMCIQAQGPCDPGTNSACDMGCTMNGTSEASCNVCTVSVNGGCVQANCCVCN